MGSLQLFLLLLLFFLSVIASYRAAGLHSFILLLCNQLELAATQVRPPSKLPPRANPCCQVPWLAQFLQSSEEWQRFAPILRCVANCRGHPFTSVQRGESETKRRALDCPDTCRRALHIQSAHSFCACGVLLLCVDGTAASLDCARWQVPAMIPPRLRCACVLVGDVVDAISAAGRQSHTP